MIDGNCASRFVPINMTSHLLWFGVALLVLLLWANAVPAIQSCHTKTPLPRDLHLVAPETKINASIRRFAGVWSGSWDDEVCTTLVVQEVFQNGYARVIYS